MGVARMNTKHVAWWLAGVLAVMIVMAAGAWSLGAATAFAYGDELTAASTSAAKTATAAADTANADASSSATQDSTVKTTADTATKAGKKLDVTDPLPGSEKLPLRSAQNTTATAPASAPTPASLTVCGMKYLEGRALKAGEFSFTMIPSGVYALPINSPLVAQLRQGSSLSAAEKYELVAHGGLAYVSSDTQPQPAASTVSNAADGSITFSPLVFDAASLGKNATRRYAGSVFSYTIAEVVPRNADGTMKDGVVKDDEDRAVYQGITYDNAVKRVYIYAYQAGDSATDAHIEIVPLGDDVFSGKPEKSVTGQGDGFLNYYEADEGTEGGAASDDTSSGSGGAASDKPNSTTPDEGTTPDVGVTPDEGTMPDGPSATTPDESGQDSSTDAPHEPEKPEVTNPSDKPADSPSESTPPAATAPSEGSDTGDAPSDAPADTPADTPTGSIASTPSTESPAEGTATDSRPASGADQSTAAKPDTTEQPAAGAGSSNTSEAGATDASSASSAADSSESNGDEEANADANTSASTSTVEASDGQLESSDDASAAAKTTETTVTTVVASKSADSATAVKVFPQTDDTLDRFFIVSGAVIALSALLAAYAYRRMRA